MATIKDIAKITGCSVMTVSRALNNPELSAVVSNTELDNDEMTEQSYQIHLSRLDGFEILSYSYNPETKEYTCTARALKH